MRPYFELSIKKAPQSESSSSKQAQNSADGYSFLVDIWKRLERFLILGSEGGTYYATERKHTKENAEAVIECIKDDGVRVVTKIIEISKNGRSHKNSPALFAMALAISLGNNEIKDLVVKTLPNVARTGTHLFEFVNYAKTNRGWGRSLKRAVSNWYTSKNLNDLVYQTLKYRQRNGWTHQDCMRLAHPLFPIDDVTPVYVKWLFRNDNNAVGGLNNDLLQSYIKLQDCTESGAVELIQGCKDISWEMLPTQFLKSTKVWGALLEHLPLTALLRNLGKLTLLGVLKPLMKETEFVSNLLTNKEILKKSRLHPLSIFVALRTYKNGKSRGGLEWTPVSTIEESLEEAFYLSFDNVIPTNKRILLALDVSGSMSWGNVLGVENFTPREASGLMAMLIARTEKNHQFMAFGHKLMPLNISSKDSIETVTHKIDNLDFGGTDCSLPMIWALENKIPVDCFVVLTDSETWAGDIHPHQALVEYRNKMNIQAKLVVVGMTSNNFTIADPDDGGMMDVVGFDTSTPTIINDFIRD